MRKKRDLRRFIKMDFSHEFSYFIFAFLVALIVYYLTKDEEELEELRIGEKE